jgi:DNA-binding PadR family transcriptional regulator
MKDRAAKDGQAAGLRSTLAWPLLGLLVSRPSYGYELAQRFRRTFGDEVVLSGNVMIYRTLEMLSSRGLIEAIPPEPGESDASRQPKISYRASAAGVRAYQERLIGEVAEQHRRSLMFTHQLVMLKPQDALDVIDQYERECLDDAEQATPADVEQAAAGGRNRLTRRLEAEDERVTVGVQLSWTEYARHELKAVIAERENDNELALSSSTSASATGMARASTPRCETSHSSSRAANW